MKILILGPGCANCEQLEQLIHKALKQLSLVRTPRSLRGLLACPGIPILREQVGAYFRKCVILLSVAILFAGPVSADNSARVVIKGASSADKTPVWYAMDWVVNSPYSPEFELLDTDSAFGRYALMTKKVTLKDLVKFHGHACDGLVQTAMALKLATEDLFPDGIVDRTDLRILSKNAPCYVDVAAYLTGGRINFGTMEVDNTLGDSWVVQCISNGKAVKVSRREGVFPKELQRLEDKVKSGMASPEELTQTRDLAWDFAKQLLTKPPADAFTLEELNNFEFPESVYKSVGPRGDIKHKNDPY